MKTTKEGVGVHSLAHIILRVKWPTKAPEWKLR
jgi:hypothetical protein